MPHTSASTPGSLYVVATPIGNIQDISLRALAILKSVDTILAEDTRHSSHLLKTLGIEKPLNSFHAFNEEKKSEEIITRLLNGESFALISDAGTPLISDPGYPLIKKARAQQISVVPIPGACALIAALSASGIPCDPFTFAGFLPAKKSARCEKLKFYATIFHTLIFYESPHRIIDTLDDISLIFGEDTLIALAKELTKTHERYIINTPNKVKDWLLEDPTHVKGEFIIIISPREESTVRMDADVLNILLKKLPLKTAVQLANTITNIPKNELYKKALEIKQTDE